jgi:hypothetical protein
MMPRIFREGPIPLDPSGMTLTVPFSSKSRTDGNPGQNPNSSAIPVRSLNASRRTEASLIWNDRNSLGDST